MRTKTLLPLATWGQIIGIDPYNLHQISEGKNTLTPEPISGQVNKEYRESAFQLSEHLAREEVRQAISDAENLIAGITGFFPAPKYLVNQEVIPQRNYNSQYYPSLYTPMYQFNRPVIEVQRYVRDIGTENLTVIEADANVVLSSSGINTISDTFTVTTTVSSGTVASEVVLFFTATDRLSQPQDQYEIRPISVSISGTTATITGKAYLLVKPEIYEVYNSASQDITDNTIFVDTVDVYRRTTDTTDAGSLNWTRRDTSVGVSAVFFNAIDANAGILSFAPGSYADDGTFSPSCDNYAYGPNRIFINYLSGYPLDPTTNQMNSQLARAVAYLATAMLPQKSSDTRRASQRLEYYRLTPGQSENTYDPATLQQLNMNLFPAYNGRGALMATQILYNLGLVSYGSTTI